MIYDIEKSYLENANEGPYFTGEIPPSKAWPKKIDFLGFQINSPLGVPAGPLLNSKWIALAAKLGFDVPTYKTIRSFEYPGHPLPNVVYVNRLGGDEAAISAQKEQSLLTITNSFGMPSRSQEYLSQDIEKANQSLQEGQVMIVSIVGTPGRGVSFLEDFVRAASLAKDAGAKIIEANFSCPNVEKSEGSLYSNVDAVYEFGKKIKEAIHPIPLLIKVGAFSNVGIMRQVFLSAANAGIAGICGLNSVSMKISPALSPARPTSGVCGAAIREEALQFMKEATQIKTSEKLELELLGCGGIVLPEHFQDMLDAGALIAMSATGMMWDPFLAIKCKELYREE